MFITDQTFLAILIYNSRNHNHTWHRCTTEFYDQINQNATHTVKGKLIMGANLGNGTIVWSKKIDTTTYAKVESARLMQAWEESEILTFA